MSTMTNTTYPPTAMPAAGRRRRRPPLSEGALMPTPRRRSRDPSQGGSAERAALGIAGLGLVAPTGAERTLRPCTHAGHYPAPARGPSSPAVTCPRDKECAPVHNAGVLGGWFAFALARSAGGRPVSGPGVRASGAAGGLTGRCR